MPNTSALAGARQRLAEIAAEKAALERDLEAAMQARAARIIEGGDGPEDRDAIPRLEDAIAARARAMQVLREQIAALELAAERERLEAEHARDVAAERAVAAAMRQAGQHLAEAMCVITGATTNISLYHGANDELGRAWRQASHRRDPDLLLQLIDQAARERLDAIDRRERARTGGQSGAVQIADTAVYALRGFHYNIRNAEVTARRVPAGTITMIEQAAADIAVARGLAVILPPEPGTVRIEMLRNAPTGEGRLRLAGWQGVLPHDDAMALIASGAAKRRTQLTAAEVAAYRAAGRPELTGEFGYGVDLGVIDGAVDTGVAA